MRFWVLTYSDCGKDRRKTNARDVKLNATYAKAVACGRETADAPFDFAQGKLFGNDKKKSKTMGS